MLSGEFWKHLLLKLSAASTLLLQAFQGKGAVKRNRHQLYQNRDCGGSVLFLSRKLLVQVLEYKAKNKRTKETLLTCLADLFYSIVTQKRKVDFVDFSLVP